MWLRRCLDRIERQGGAVFLIAPPVYGGARLISGLDGKNGPLVWLELDAGDAGDPIAQGNKLAEAVKRALGSALFAYALPYTVGLNLLKGHLELLGPLTFALSGAEHGREFAAKLLDLHQQGSHVVLAFHTSEAHHRLGLDVPADAFVLDEDALRMTETEALHLAAGRLEDEVVLSLLETCGYAHETFLAELHQRLNLPLPSILSPHGAQLPPGHEIEIEPAALLTALITKQDWLKAAEVAVYYLPERVQEVMAEAGHAYHERGLHERLWRLLARLPRKIRGEGSVLFWRLSAAARLKRADEVRGEVEAYLLAHESPELRALHAGIFLDVDEAVGETARAYRAQVTPFTACQYGLMLDDAQEGARLLREAVRLAERSGRGYEIARNAGALTSRLIDAGSYFEAARWGEWALEHFDRLGLSDGQRRLYLLNDWAYARILSGETAGLEELLKEGESQLESAFPGLLELFRSTLGDYLVAAQRAPEALIYYRPNWEGAPRKMYGIRGLSMTRALLEQAEQDAALKIAEQAFYLTKDDSWDYHRPAVLAYGMALLMNKPGDAKEHFEKVLRTHESLPAPHLAQASLWLAQAQLSLHDADGAKETIEGAKRGLAELSATGLRLFSGPEGAFRDVWRLCRRDVMPLELRFLGTAEVWLNDESLGTKDEPLQLYPQLSEILVLLALHPEGLTLDRLLLLIAGDTGSRNALQVALSKVRRKVPLSPPPYTLQVAYKADFLEARALLNKGQLRQALELYRGPLLPDSEAPGIIEERESLEEAFRQTALALSDPEALLVLAEKFKDDPELWEAAGRTLPKGDPRAPVVRARVQQVFKDLI